MQITKFTDFINFAEFATRKKKFEIKKRIYHILFGNNFQ